MDVSRTLARADAVADCLSQKQKPGAPSDAQNQRAHWMARQQERAWIRRQATSCVIVHGGMLVVVAFLSSVAAWILARNTLGAVLALDVNDHHFSSISYYSPDAIGIAANHHFSLGALTSLPMVLLTISVILLILLVVGLRYQRLPGYRSSAIALDCSAMADAMHHMTLASIPYEEAFRHAQDVVSTSDVRYWIHENAERIKRGQNLFNTNHPRGGDLGVMEMMLDAGTTDSVQDHSRRWQTVANHFLAVARSRSSLLTQSLPPLATLFSGMLAWMAVSGTLGFMWRCIYWMPTPLRGTM